MNDFLAGSWAVISGIATGPIGLFFGAFVLVSLAVILILTVGSGSPKLNQHVPMPENKGVMTTADSLEDLRNRAYDKKEESDG